MSLWARTKRVFRSLAGWFVELGENPELILKQNIRDLEDQIPLLNENLATIKANETLQRREVEKLGKQEAELTNKVKAALSQGNRELAMNFATTLKQVRNQKASAQEQLTRACTAYEKALKIQRAYLAEKDRKVKEARNALNAKKKSEWQAKVADAMSSFNAAGVDATHEEMIRKIEQHTAHGEAKLEIALESVPVQNLDLDAEAERMAANETLRQFELEMGLLDDGLSAARPKTIGSLEQSPADLTQNQPGAQKTAQKTIGREHELA